MSEKRHQFLFNNFKTECWSWPGIEPGPTAPKSDTQPIELHVHCNQSAVHPATAATCIWLVMHYVMQCWVHCGLHKQLTVFKLHIISPLCHSVKHLFHMTNETSSEITK